MITSGVRNQPVTFGKTRSGHDQSRSAEIVGCSGTATQDQQSARCQVGHCRPDLRRDHSHYGAGVEQAPNH
jgi:hypothetical protein